MSSYPEERINKCRKNVSEVLNIKECMDDDTFISIEELSDLIELSEDLIYVMIGHHSDEFIVKNKKIKNKITVWKEYKA